MNKALKHKIKLLADKFNHNIGYDKEVLILTNDLNKIRIWTVDKYGINISFNSAADSIQEMKPENIFDLLLQLLTRKNIEDQLIKREGVLLNIDEWIKEEGDFVIIQMEELKNDLKTQQIDHRDMGGNRCLVEYYKGILIFIDDLSLAQSNVVTLL